MPTDKPRFTVTVSDTMKKSIEDFQYSNRIRNQNQAVSQLIERGLDSLSNEPAKPSSIHSPKSVNDFSCAEYEMVKKYRALDEHGKGIIDIVLQKEFERIESLNDSESSFDSLPFRISDQPAAAGYGVYLGPESFRTVMVKSEALPRRASFGVPVSGDSMEPKYHDGDILIVSADKPERGEVGIYTMDGQGYVKVLGHGELLSLNPDYAPIPMMDGIICNGKVIGVLKKDVILDQ